MPAAKSKVCIIGSGNWGSAIARIIGSTVKQHSTEYDEIVKMWVFEEMVNGRKLSEIINTDHENVKYLPGKKLPDNVVAVPDLVESVKDADVLVFVVPHQFVHKICDQMKNNIKSDAIGISLIKGLASKADGSIKLISEEINEILGIEMTVLMGANLAHEVAADNFCESTIGSKHHKTGIALRKLFHTQNFRINVVRDSHTVELCGALKNVVACAAGFCDGLGYGDNTKAAVIRLGLMEMVKFVEHFYPGSQLSSFFESCGIADLVTTCYGGRNRRCCEAYVKSGKSLETLEQELLGGQRLQGPHTAQQVIQMLSAVHLVEKYPLFSAVHQICSGAMKPDKMVDCLRNHPTHM